MNFTHSEDRRMLADMLGRYLAERYPIEARNVAAYGDHGFSTDHWSMMVQLGIVGALFGEAAGGYGGDGFDIMVVFEQLGRALAVEPFLGTLMAGHALVAAGGHAELPAIVAGELVPAFAHQERAGDATEAIETIAVEVEGHWVLTGIKSVVVHAEAAGIFLVSARTRSGFSLFAVPSTTAGVTVRGYANIDGGRSGEVVFEAVRVPLQALVAAEGGGEQPVAAAMDAGLLALCAEAVGIMDVLKDATLEYLRTRAQFGQPIGKFQALQHRMAAALIEIDQARSSVINAAAAFNGDDPIERLLALSAAKYTIGRTGTLVAEDAVQLHGAIGMTWELPLSHYAKRLTMIGHQLGDEDHHLARYARAARRRVPAQEAA
ncbi:MAG: pimeloyl-CoA dehydrogenase small subunit [Bradyrhizobium sp.]|nr:pimeloyl-CoA dehydrogenase small subunit [Bradyrhizobium sp.]